MTKTVLLFDYNNLAMRVFHAANIINKDADGKIYYDWQMFRWATWNSIYYALVKFKNANRKRSGSHRLRSL